MITVSHVTCGYNANAVIEDVSLELQAGKAICVLGANGAGKTTLFKSMLGWLPLVDGRIFVEENEIHTLSNKEIARKIAYVPQQRAFSYPYSVENVVMMGRAQYIPKFGVPSEKDYTAVKKAMKMLNIQEMADQAYPLLSGGEQQLVLISRAIAQGATYLLMDEPASNLDMANQELLLQTVNRLKAENVGVMMISHSPDHAFRCCESTLFIFRDGHCAFGKTEEIVTSENLKAAYNTEKIEVLSGVSASGEVVRTCSFV